MRHFLLSVLLLLPLSSCFAVSFQEGESYKLLPQAQPTMDENKIEVVELFWYGCPHCHKFQPYIEEVVKRQKPDKR